MNSREKVEVIERIAHVIVESVGLLNVFHFLRMKKIQYKLEMLVQVGYCI